LIFLYLKIGGLIDKTNIEKQVSFLTMNKLEESHFQDNLTKSNLLSNTNPLYLPGNGLGLSRESKFFTL